MAPLTIPQRPQGGLRAPLLDYPPGSVGAFESAGGAIYTGRLHRRASAPKARAVYVSCYGGARRFAVARFRRELVLRVGSSGENVGTALVFELWGLFAVLLRQRVTNLASRSGEQGRRSSLQERTFVCN